MSLEIVAPKGFFGIDLDQDELIDSILRELAVLASANPSAEGAEKYGTNFENDVFLMHQYCWCEEEDCLWCCIWLSNEGDFTEEESRLHRKKQEAQMKILYGSNMIYPDAAPHFWYKPLDFQLQWYKYIGRSVEVNKELPPKQLQEMFYHCVESLKLKK